MEHMPGLLRQHFHSGASIQVPGQALQPPPVLNQLPAPQLVGVVVEGTHGAAPVHD